MNNLAPIVLFVYNRPFHTEQTLIALTQNELADQSILYIFADGPKEAAGEEHLHAIESVRKIIRSKNWCKEVHIIESIINKGLADSIIEGVTQIVNKYGKIIVLEDDLVTSKGFLKYMNDALTLYENDNRVFHVSGYMFPVKATLPQTFFYRQASCWGWATWANRWIHLEKSAAELYRQLKTSGKIDSADIDGTNQFLPQLIANMNGKLKTWAILWHFSVLLKDGLSLHPGKSLVKNIGMDNSGLNCSVTDKFDVELSDSVHVKKIAVKDFTKLYGYLKLFYHPVSKSNILAKVNQKIKTLVPAGMKRRIKKIINKKFKEAELQKTLLQNSPRFTEFEILFLNTKIRIVDNLSFQFMSKELFEQQIYKFKCATKEPYIIDCGANIGLSIIYFKQLYPNAEIIAFEPDDRVFKVLENNVKAFGLSNVQLIKKACWNKETTIKFYSEGADGGRAEIEFDKQNIIEVESIRLRKFLNRKIDFLKIDIEGAENEVIEDIKDLLYNVDRVFVEFHSFAGKEQMLSEILAILKEAGFRINIHHIGVYSPNPFVSVLSNNNMDMQLNIYGYRL